MSAAPVSEALPIGEAQRDGGYQIVVSEGGEFALVRWRDQDWVFSSGVKLDFEPTHYLPRAS
jgi:hypothetical protein